jgi:hypothetical protein
MKWWRERVGLRGYPPSGNGASSFHLWWQVPSQLRVVEARATLEVRVPPAVDRLYFWALQVSFEDRGRQYGGAHTGLQWHPGSPGGAVNWGGYAQGGGELSGTTSALPEVDSVNTRRWAWSPGVPYQFRVWSPSAGAWRSSVTDLGNGETTVIRDLLVPATTLTAPVVWAEVFARCDDPPTEARWTDLSVVGEDGAVHGIEEVNITYQDISAGGCSNTEAAVDGDAFVQRTGLPSGRTPAPRSLAARRPDGGWPR